MISHLHQDRTQPAGTPVSVRFCPAGGRPLLIGDVGVLWCPLREPSQRYGPSSFIGPPPAQPSDSLMRIRCNRAVVITRWEVRRHVRWYNQNKRQKKKRRGRTGELRGGTLGQWTVHRCQVANDGLGSDDSSRLEPTTPLCHCDGTG